jgi:hypothetical protein
MAIAQQIRDLITQATFGTVRLRGRKEGVYGVIFLCTRAHVVITSTRTRTPRANHRS